MTTIPYITQYAGDIPDKATMDKNTFANSVYYYLRYFNDTFVPDTQTYADKLNDFSNDMVAIQEDVTNKQSDIAEMADSVEQAKETCFATANFKGAWDKNNSYTHPSAVTYNGVVFVTLKDVPENTDINNTEYWQKISSERYVDINSNYTASINEYLFVDTSNNAITVTLPSNPLENVKVNFVDRKGTFDKNNLTVKRGDDTHKIMGLEEDMTVDTKNISFGLIYKDGDWRLI